MIKMTFQTGNDVNHTTNYITVDVPFVLIFV